MLVLRRIRKIPRFAVYLLWFVPFIRLWIPFGIANRYSLLTLISQFTTKTVIMWRNAFAPEISMTNYLMGANRYFPIDYKTDLLKGVFDTASVIWAVIALAAVMTSVLLYSFTKAELKNAVRVRDNIYKSDKILAPAVYGIIKPKIILPDSLPENSIDVILSHESVHIRRRDILLRGLAVITACIHWFNPLVWIFLSRFFTDMELACDAKVIRHMNEQQIKQYASSVLAVSYRKAWMVSAFGGAKTRVRIENILSYKKLTLLSTACFALLILAIAAGLLTNAAG